MTDTNQSEEEVAARAAEEQSYLEALKDEGITIVVEDADHKIGHLSRYAIVGRRGTDEEDPTIEVIGGDRLDALKALLVRSSMG